MRGAPSANLHNPCTDSWSFPHPVTTGVAGAIRIAWVSRAGPAARGGRKFKREGQAVRCSEHCKRAAVRFRPEHRPGGKWVPARLPRPAPPGQRLRPVDLARACQHRIAEGSDDLRGRGWGGWWGCAGCASVAPLRRRLQERPPQSCSCSGTRRPKSSARAFSACFQPLPSPAAGLGW